MKNKITKKTQTCKNVVIIVVVVVGITISKQPPPPDKDKEEKSNRKALNLINAMTFPLPSISYCRHTHTETLCITTAIHTIPPWPLYIVIVRNYGRMLINDVVFSMILIGLLWSCFPLDEAFFSPFSLLLQNNNNNVGGLFLVRFDFGT